MGKKNISTRQVSAKQRKNTTAATTTTATTTTAASAAASPLPAALHTHTHSGTHARWLRAPFHWQSVDVVSVGFGRVRAVTASKINARIILPTLLLLLFLLLLWRALNPTHTLTHTHTYRNTAKNTASAAATASVDDALTRTGVPLCGCRHKTVSEA